MRNSNIYILLFFIMCFFSSWTSKEYFAENCSLFIKAKTNPITGKVSFASKEKFIFSESYTKFELLIVRQHLEVTLNLKSDANICVSKGLKVVATTLDDKKLTLYSKNQKNCNSSLLFSFGGFYGKEKALEVLRDRGLLSLSFNDIKGESHTLMLYKDDQQKLKSSIECMLSKAM